LGTFLRSFTFGHVRQLDAVSRDALQRAWAAGMRPGKSDLTMDLDSTICDGLRPGQARGGFRLHQGARLSPPAGHQGGYRGASPLPFAGRVGPHRQGGRWVPG
jgi:hypothetical protein